MVNLAQKNQGHHRKYRKDKPEYLKLNGMMRFEDPTVNKYTPEQITHPNPIPGQWTYPKKGWIRWRINP